MHSSTAIKDVIKDTSGDTTHLDINIGALDSVIDTPVDHDKYYYILLCNRTLWGSMLLLLIVAIGRMDIQYLLHYCICYTIVSVVQL